MNVAGAREEKAGGSGRSAREAERRRLQGDNEGSSDDSLDDSFVKIRLQPAASTEEGEIPRAPPPSRNLSRSELPKGDSLEEESSSVGGSIGPSTPPPSRSMSSSELSSSVFTINEIEESGPYLIPPTPGYKRQPSTGSKPLTDEVAAAMSLSLGTQGYDLEEAPSFCVIPNDQDTSNNNAISPNPTGSSLPQTFAFIKPDPAASQDLSSNESSNFSSDFSIVSGSSRQGPPALQLYQPDKEEIQATLQTLASDDLNSMTAKDAKVLTYLLGATNWDQEKVLVYVANAAAFTKNQVSSVCFSCSLTVLLNLEITECAECSLDFNFSYKPKQTSILLFSFLVQYILEEL